MFFLPLVILMSVILVGAIYVFHLFHFIDVWEDFKAMQSYWQELQEIPVEGAWWAERAWGRGGKSCGWSTSYKGTLSRPGSKTQPEPAWQAAVTGYQKQHSHFNITLLRSRIYQPGRSAALKCLYFFQAPLNFISTQKCKYGLTLLLTKLNLINICECLPWGSSCTAVFSGCSSCLIKLLKIVPLLQICVPGQALHLYCSRYCVSTPSGSPYSGCSVVVLARI